MKKKNKRTKKELKIKWIDSKEVTPEENIPYLVVGHGEDPLRLGYEDHDLSVFIAFWEYGEFRTYELQRTGARFYLPILKDQQGLKCL